MDWTSDEAVVLREDADGVPWEAVKRVASKAVELAAARGGTMTAEHVAEARALLGKPGAWGDDRVSEMLAHIAAQGARVAVLEAELAKSNKAEFARAEECMSLRERLTAAEEGNRELVRRAQQAEAQRDQWKTTAQMWSRRVEAAADELSDVGAGECGRLDIVTRVRMLKARCATLSAAGQVLSVHVDKDDPCQHSGVINVRADGVWFCETCQEPFRWPCSSTCTHDDAAKPGHPERVRERSEAVNEAAAAAVEMVRRDNELTRAYENGAEAMRTACLEAVQRVGQTLALGPTEMEMVKSAIAGAAP